MPTTINGTTGVSQIQDDTVTIPKIDATGTPSSSTFLRGDGAWETAGSPPGTLELLQEDVFTTSGTWTKATGFDPDDTVFLFVIGGGGSGGVARNSQTAATGGLGGRCAIIWGRYADVTASYPYVIGAGGAARTISTNTELSGNNGGQTLIYFGSVDTTNRFSTANGGLGGAGAASTSATTAGPVSDSTVDLAGGFSTNGIAPGFVLGNNQVLYYPTSTGVVYSNSNTYDNAANRPYNNPPICGRGGGAARDTTTNRTVWNAATPGVFNNSGSGSGTGTGQNATGFGGGGGGAVNNTGTVTSGAGGGGALVARYYRGRVSPWQFIFGSTV
jgi:hypothetical protein